MTIKQKIKKRIAELEKDDRFTQPTASVQINAPLALIQVGIASKIDALQWVLDEMKIVEKA